MQKQLPAWAALAIIIVISIGLLFLSNQLLPTPAEGQTAAEGQGAEPSGASALTASEAGFGGDVTVNITLGDDGSIASVTVDAPGETEGIGSRVNDEAAFLEQFVGKTSTDGVDALSGATITSEAVIKAVDKALSGDGASASSAGGEAAGAASGDSLTASEAGFGGDVTVNVTLADDGSIAAVTVDAPGETAGIGSRVIHEAAFLEQFVGKTSSDGVDALSGATITSEAVIKAVDKALASQ